MKNTFRTYLYLTLALLLGTLSSLHANAVNSIGSNLTYSNQYVDDLDVDSFQYSTIHQNSDFDYFAEAPEKEESENEESSSKTKLDSIILDATAFINALLFENSSKELEKSVFRSPNTITRAKFRLYADFQVFII